MKNSDFRMAPSGNSRDTTISYILGILGGVFIVLSVIKSIISRGAVERIYGVLMISAFLMALGIVFGVIGYHSEEGGVTSKKMAVYLNIVVFVIAGIFFIKGM